MIFNFNRFNIITLTFILLIYIIKCQDTLTECDKCKNGDALCTEEGCLSCNDNHRYFYESTISNNKCIECDFSQSPNSYYTLKTESEEESCELITKKRDNLKLIYGQKQVVQNCPPSTIAPYSINLGDICYSENDINNELIDNSGDNYNCKGYYYQQEINDFIYKICLPTAEEGKNFCPYNFKHYDEKECRNNCPDGKKFIKKEKNGDSTIFRCSSGCNLGEDEGENREYKYEDKDENNNLINTYCLDKCPKYYHEPKEGVEANYLCVSQCDDGYLPLKDKCIEISSCKSIFIENIASNTISCYSIEVNAGCPYNYPYLYVINESEENEKRYCLKSCQDTNVENTLFEKKETYFIEIESIKYCKYEQEGKYKDKKALKFVDDCKSSLSGPYTDEDDYCTDDCGEKKIIFSTLKCQDEPCPSELVESSNFCYEECPINSDKRFKKNGKCQDCNYPSDLENVGDDEGFYLSGDKTCYNSCSEIDPDNSKIFYHNDNENICYESAKGCLNNQIYKYTINYQDTDKLRICYKSCFDIGADYKYEKDYICYTEEEINNEPIKSSLNGIYYYTNSTSGYTKYISDSEEKAREECFQLGYKYLNDKQCVENCQEENYKVLNTEKKFGICYANSENCISNGYIFYNNTEKICSKKCLLFTVVNTENEPIQDGENCLSSCPTESNSYIYEDKNFCKSSCNFYIEDSDKLKCTDECQFYNIDGDSKKICTEKCKNNNKYSFYLTTSEPKGKCIDSCKNQNLFSYDSTDDHQPCITECPKDKGYLYYDDNNICYKQCKNYYLKIDDENTKCVDHCENTNKVFPGNICKSSTEECPSEAPFFFEENIEGTDFTVTKCVSSCSENNFNFYKDSNKECKNNCEGEENLKFNGVCYSVCPEGLYQSGNECVLNCESNLFKKEGNKLICTDDCGENYITSSGECVEKCPIGQNFVEKNNENKNCLTSCKQFEKQFYQKKEDVDLGNGDTYRIYECLSNLDSCETNTQNPVSIQGKKECISGCGDLYKYRGVCYTSCISINNFEYSFGIEENQKECKNKCESPYPYSGSDKICIESCDENINNKTIDGDTCVDKCNINSQNKFLVLESDKYYCKEKCTNNLAKRFLKSNYICKEKCEAPYNYVVDPENEDDNSEYVNECRKECPNNKQYIRENDKGEFICSDKPCGKDGSQDEYIYYYMDTNLCLKKCDQLYSYELESEVENESKFYCVNSCDFFSPLILYHDIDSHLDGETTVYNNKCVKNCKQNNINRKYSKLNRYCSDNPDSSEFYFDNEDSDYVCLSSCPFGSISEGQICKNCNDFDPIKFIDQNGKCIEDCSNSESGYIYHNENENQCLKTCSTSKIKDNICVDSCSGNKPYSNGNICLEVCPYTKRFFINTDKNCLYDCPKTSKYYTITENNEKTFYKCQESCNAYVPNLNNKINATFCFDDNNCKNDYPYYEAEEDEEGNNIKKCYAQCPNEKPYYKEGLTENIECYNKCPSQTIHFADSYICSDISKCTSKIIRYSNMECAQQCSRKEKIFKNGDFSYCIDTCEDLPETITNGVTLYLTYDNQCISQCPSDKTEVKEGKCECFNLYYIDKFTLYKECISLTITSCENFKEYPITKVNSQECVDYCDGVLSSSGYDCYPDDYTCKENYEILTTFINGNKVCDCIDKYYYTYNEIGNKVKNCLKKDENCPISYNYLIKETRECINKCPDEKYNKEFGSTCLSACPSSTKVDETNSNICICKDKYYLDKDNINVCLENDCIEEYPLIIEGSKQCIAKCPDNMYLDYTNKKCIENCNTLTNRVATTSEGDEIASKFAKNKCRCLNNWYYDEITKEEICLENNIDCSSISNKKYNFIIGPTNQCVKSCSGDYKFIFGNKCFKSCEQASEITNQRVIEGDENYCKCEDFSKYDDKSLCLTIDECKNKGFSIINDVTKQCYEKIDELNCPKDYPIYFNGYCYKENQCPTNTEYNQFTQECSCKYKWYKEDSKIICLSKEGNCPSEYPLIVYSTNECKKENDLNLLEFNYILYSNCPLNTQVEKSDNPKKCVCDPNSYWYKEEKLEGKTYYICSQKECPESNPYINEGSKECISNCGEKYIYRGICYNNCPELTEVGDNKVCVLSPINNELTFDNLEETITNKVTELYKKVDTSSEIISDSSQKIKTKDATVEFYGVNKKNKGNNQKNIQSDLSYIDISECIEKIYKSNGMNSDDDIIILKFDINNPPEKYLINPVEYKFVNSRTGQILDASVCEHNSIKISYPLHDLINKYDNMLKKRNLEYVKLDLNSNNKDTLREKLDKGKEIFKEYSNIDIFNINDKIYSDICIAVEVDGKDLILKDRINYFYPQMSLCENNCTYNHTDYDNERIYCDCSYKKEFDFNREYSFSIDINLGKVNNDQGININAGVIKCISNLKNTKSISGNGGFIYMVIIIIIEFILLLIIVFYGINSILNKLKKKMDKEEEIEENGNIEAIDIRQNEPKVKETERKLNAPPKKKENYEMEFIPPEYLFLFFNKNEKGVIKKVLKDEVPFKTKSNTRILLERNKDIKYENINPSGPFPLNQNVLVVVDNINDSISEYIYNDEDDEKIENNEIKNTADNFIKDKNIKNKSKNKFSEKHSGNEIKEKIYSKKNFDYTLSDYDPSDENYSVFDFDEEENHEKGFIESIKKEQRFLKKNYDISSDHQKSSSPVIMFITEIIDKIYIIKILLFTKKFDIFSLQLSVYFLCHALLLILLALFYDIKTIEKIWNMENYPGFGYYILYGFISCIIIWIIYKIILCLWNNNDKIKDILRLIHATKKYKLDKLIKKKYDNLSWKIKFKVIIYSIIEFILLIFCFIYFVTFCSVYTGTMIKVFKSYGIALIEILIIKIIYGFVLGILRKISLDKEIKILYNIVLFMDTYLE